jgi:hypothetical protein
MQPTTRFHDSIPNAILQEADGVLHDPVAFHPTNGMFYPHANGRDPTIRRLLRGCEFLTTRFFLGLTDRNARQAESLEALILIQTTAGGQAIPGELRDALLRCFAFMRVAQEGDVTALIDHEEVFERVPLLLAAVVVFLLLRIFRTLDWPFSTIMPKRGEVEVASVLCFVSSAANSSAVRDGRRSWAANAWFNTACNR